MNQIVTGKFITEKRKEKSMTQRQLAEKIGVSDYSVFIRIRIIFMGILYITV